MLANTVRNRAFLFNGLCNYALHEKLNIHSSIEMFSFYLMRWIQLKICKLLGDI